MLKHLIQTFIFASLLAVPLSQPVVAAHTDTHRIACEQLNQSSGSALNCEPGDSQNIFDTAVGKIINLLIFIVGTIAVIIIVVAGLMYVLSGGNPENTRRAKDAIIYAVIGLVIAII